VALLNPFSEVIDRRTRDLQAGNYEPLVGTRLPC